MGKKKIVQKREKKRGEREKEIKVSPGKSFFSSASVPVSPHHCLGRREKRKKKFRREKGKEKGEKIGKDR